MIFMKTDADGAVVAVKERVSIALARCPNCRGRFRVLPCDILPGKTYSICVIERLAGEYDRGGKGLRGVVYSLLGEAPVHSTLHGWTEGIGAYVRGRPEGALPRGVPAAAILEETARRFGGVRQEERRPRMVDERRYRTEERRIRLAAVAMVLAVARLVGGVDRWHCLIVTWFRGRSLGFRSVRRCTPIEHAAADSSLRSGPTRSKRRKRWAIGGRSPPGGSSR